MMFIACAESGVLRVLHLNGAMYLYIVECGGRTIIELFTGVWGTTHICYVFCVLMCVVCLLVGGFFVLTPVPHSCDDVAST